MGIGPYGGRHAGVVVPYGGEGRETGDGGRETGDGRPGCQGMSQPRRFRDCFHWRTRRQAASMSDSERVPSAMAERTAGIWVR